MLRPYVHDIGGKGTVSHALKKTTTEFRFRIVSKKNLSEIDLLWPGSAKKDGLKNSAIEVDRRG